MGCPPNPQNATRYGRLGNQVRVVWASLDGLPDAPHPEQAQAGEQARAAQVQAGDRALDAVPVRDDVQAPVVRHVALHTATGRPCWGWP